MTSPTLRAGEQLASTVCAAKVVVVRASAGDAVLACGGSPMIPASSAQPAPASGGGGTATLIGKRYVNADDTLEVLCTSSGTGELSCDGVPMTLKAAKPLPASD